MAEYARGLSDPIEKLNALYKWLKENENKVGKTSARRQEGIQAGSSLTLPCPQALCELEDFRSFLQEIQSGATPGQFVLNL